MELLQKAQDMRKLCYSCNNLSFLLFVWICFAGCIGFLVIFCFFWEKLWRILLSSDEFAIFAHIGFCAICLCFAYCCRSVRFLHIYKGFYSWKRENKLDFCCHFLGCWNISCIALCEFLWFDFLCENGSCFGAFYVLGILKTKRENAELHLLHLCIYVWVCDWLCFLVFKAIFGSFDKYVCWLHLQRFHEISRFCFASKFLFIILHFCNVLSDIFAFQWKI